MWRIRLEQAAGDPTALAWIARAARDGRTGEVVGHVGFHGPPDYRGMVEVAYAVDPAYRRRGYARAMLRTALAWAAAEPTVEVVRASISPENHASMATLRPFGFRHIGEQYDEEDGLELLFERPARTGRPAVLIRVPSPRSGSRCCRHGVRGDGTAGARPGSAGSTTRGRGTSRLASPDARRSPAQRVAAVAGA